MSVFGRGAPPVTSTAVWRTIAPSGGATGPSHYFHVDDSTNSAGKIGQIACRVTGILATTAGAAPNRNTTFISGKVTAHHTANNQTLRATSAVNWSGTQAHSIIIRLYLTSYSGGSASYAAIDNVATSRIRFIANASLNRYQRVGAGTTANDWGTVLTGAWYTKAVSYDGTNARFYQDGVLVGGASANAQSVTSATTLWLGNSGATVGIVGHWGIARFFNRALSASEMASEHALCVAEGYV